MNLSDAGRAFIERQEGCCLTAYWDVDGWSIGYGHHSRGVVEGMQITREQADAFLDGDTQWVTAAVNHLVIMPLSQNAFDALCSFVYNEGAGALKGSTLLRNIDAGVTDAATITADFVMWNKVKQQGAVLVVDAGLTLRRHAEAALFLTPDGTS